MTNPPLPPVIAHAFKMQEAAVCLLQNGYRLPALMLVYTTIDQMAWLSISGTGEAKGTDFIAWVDKYMLAHHNSGLEGVTAGDLWGARCGLLHTATAESRSLKNGTADSRIAYTYGRPVVPTLPDGWHHVDISDLVTSLLTAVVWFRDEIDSDAELAKSANEKLALMLQDQTF
ncbi:hypothetical protein [Janthinobacterium sp. NKUCC06_STL]|jgi:hypothetical protein|uniref:hypothetical protein n=1 Tax=Janthinobacterium sp. NKUCC06_STL TaxID=2842127 RepID=UPI001C5A8277|nr:hypothetical protein [Janthinobacterium sp. NKUCC06_STL]MBW3512222.1 hypothetical protein [Janthinobacterium sp. NKUCC06_STL]